MDMQNMEYPISPIGEISFWIIGEGLYKHLTLHMLVKLLAYGKLKHGFH